jgi:DNA-binding NarL/FixJ family response regulator
MQALRVPSSITSRQKQVVELIAQGLSNDEVGLELGISPRTAKAHCDVLRQSSASADHFRSRDMPPKELTYPPKRGYIAACLQSLTKEG